MRTFDEAGVVYLGKDGKTGDRGTPMMFVGYVNRESNSYRMWNPSTIRVSVTHDVVWMKRMFQIRPAREHYVVPEPEVGEFDDKPAAEPARDDCSDADSDMPNSTMEKNDEDGVERHATWANHRY